MTEWETRVRPKFKRFLELCAKHVPSTVERDQLEFAKDRATSADFVTFCHDILQPNLEAVKMHKLETKLFIYNVEVGDLLAKVPDPERFWLYLEYFAVESKLLKESDINV